MKSYLMLELAPTIGHVQCCPVRADKTTGGSGFMGQQLRHYPTKRRFPRVHGPFDGYHVGPQTPILVYDLNLGGGFVSFGDTQPSEVDFVLKVALPQEGMVTVHAETVYRVDSGVAVRFVDVDVDTFERLARTVDALIEQPPAN
jgi:hypothetical protein